MRYYSKKYKRKVSEFIRKANRNDFGLSFYLDLLGSMSDVKKSIRMSRRDGEVLRYDLAVEHHGFRSIPLYTKNGVPLGLNRMEFNSKSSE